MCNKSGTDFGQNDRINKMEGPVQDSFWVYSVILSKICLIWVSGCSDIFNY